MRGSRALVLPLIGGLLGVLLVSTMVLRTSSALFTGTTDNPNNAWTMGTVSLTDDDSAAAMFTTAGDGNLTGGQTLTRCIKVTYGGSLTAATAVKLYDTVSGAGAQYLNLTVDQGSGTTFPSCTGFSVSTAGIYSGTLQAFGADSNFTTGVGSWAPGATGASMVYRFTITVQSTIAAQGTSAAASFTWEAQG
jgi:hypothetical protein